MVTRYLSLEASCLIYYVGNTLMTYVQTFGNNSVCSGSCIDNMIYSSTILIVIGIVGFTMTPLYFNEAKNVFDVDVRPVNIPSRNRKEMSLIRTTIHIAALVLDLDGWYSTVVDLQLISTSSCSSFEWVWTLAFSLILILVWILYVGLTFLPSLAIARKQKSCKKVSRTLVALSVSFWTAILYLVSDNSLPIGCIFDCSDLEFNDSSCNTTAYYTIRAVFLFLIILMLTALFLLGACRLMHNIVLYQTTN